MTHVRAQGLRVRYGAATVVDGIHLELEPGHVLGLVGLNGAGKSTILRALLGQVPFAGELEVLGRNPWNDRASLMNDVAYVADSILPRWLRVHQLIELMSDVHPSFDAAKAEAFFPTGKAVARRRIGELSKGSAAQLHLAVALATEPTLLVLDEPTLGLDIRAKKHLYDLLLEEHLDAERSTIIATNEVDEVEGILTDVAIVDRGRIVVAASIDECSSRFVEVRVRPEGATRARDLGPISERSSLGYTVFLFDGVDRDALAALGETKAPTLGELLYSITSRDREDAAEVL